VSKLGILALVILLISPGSVAAKQKIPIILDTDIGTDIDDAFALALIINSPELELLGVTTVSGDTQARARLAAKMLWEAGGAWRRVPVYAGEPGKPLPIVQTRWAEGFASPQLKSEKAVEYLRSEFDRRPGEITLVTIGPLTNIGSLLQQSPEVAKKIKQIVMMGGSIAHGYGDQVKPAAEYNIAQDPAAARAVFSSGIPIVMAPLDVTAMLPLDEASRHRVFTQLTPVTNALAILYYYWNQSTPILFDPMAVALLIDPSLCQTETRAVEVDDQGFTRVGEGKPANATVGMHTHPAEFFEFYLPRVAPEKR